MAPIGLATIVAISRVVDYRHDFADVNAGAFIGILSGTFAYFLNYPRYAIGIRVQISCVPASYCKEFLDGKLPLFILLLCSIFAQSIFEEERFSKIATSGKGRSYIRWA